MILQSLRQCELFSRVLASALYESRIARSRWITSTFPKFSARTRGTKVAEVIPPPHTIKAHGKYDLTIGPHVFSNTAIYEVHYLPEAETFTSIGPSTHISTQSMSFVPLLSPISQECCSYGRVS